MEIKKIFSRAYDNPIDNDGNDKPNEFIGEFFVIQQIEEDGYSEIFIGNPTDPADHRLFLIVGTEVVGVNGGTRYNYYQLIDEIQLKP